MKFYPNRGLKINAKETRFSDPIDNLIYAVLMQAATDTQSCNERIANDAKEFLQNDGREYYEYLKTRPFAPPKRKYRTRKVLT